MRKLKPGWYILLYHDVSWEENYYIRSIGGTCPPDLFQRHVNALSGLGEIVSVATGADRLRKGNLTEPMFSFWFDDGLIGVRKYAVSILKDFRATGALSICSRFVNRREFFWRFKLAYLNSIDAMRLLRPMLRKHGFETGDSVKTFTLDNFSEEVLAYIEELFNRFTSPQQRADAFRMFEDREGIKSLQKQGWVIANHSAGHYPVTQAHSLNLLEAEFLECEREIQEICGTFSNYWVLPFDRLTAPNVLNVADRCREERYIVFVGGRINTPNSMEKERVLYRISAPSDEPVALLKSIALAAN